MSPVRPAAGGPPGLVALETIRFPVAGMVCGSCAVRITRALRGLDGVARVGVDLGGQAVTVRRERHAAPDSVLAAAIAEAGYVADLRAARPVNPSEALGLLDRLLRRIG